MSDLDVNQQLFFNGVGADGEYLLAPMSAADLSLVAQGQTLERRANDRAGLKELLARKEAKAKEPHLGVVANIDVYKLEQTGWGVILPAVKPGTPEDAAQQQIVDALQLLLDWRQAQAAKINDRRFQVFRHERGYRPGDSKQKYLARLGAGPGPVNPDEGVPYYLLIVGSPQVTPYSVQYQIDVQYAVGRIHFETITEYANYARSVVAAEKGGLRLGKEVAFLGVANPDDPATRLSRNFLVAPLADMVEKELHEGWNVQRFFDEKATRENLEQLLGGGGSAPALLFTGSHGMGFPNGDPRQLRQQGALLCQNWPGREQWKQPIKEDFYFSADHLRSDANLLGLIAFNFACYSGGTPQFDEFSKQAFRERKAIAPEAFVSGLHKKMLGLEKGGALAGIGHVERAWGCSFRWGTGKNGAQQQQLAAFNSTMTCLLKGMPVGAALEYFNERYAELSSDLVREIEDSEFGKELDPYEIANMWTANNDSRGYAITGDPAVRLHFGTDGGTKGREAIEVSRFGAGGAVAVPDAAQRADPAALPAGTHDATKVETMPSAGVKTNFDFASAGGKDDGDKTQSSGFQQLIDKVIGTLAGAVQDLSRLEVRTYSSSNVNFTASQSREELAQAGQLRAFTRIMINGDIDAVVPEPEGAIDSQLWGLHLELVKQAQTHRAEIIKTLLALVKGS